MKVEIETDVANGSYDICPPARPWMVINASFMSFASIFDHAAAKWIAFFKYVLYRFVSKLPGGQLKLGVFCHETEL